ncbi:MAG: gamma-glutamyltransferase [Rhodospirillaceae bacterium]|nr:gamma-glutamyltransferase [Rhodospirillaceae bacterium]
MRRFPRFSAFSLILLLAGCVAAPPRTAPDPDRPWIGQAYRNHAVSVSHPLAARAALEILNEGGGAVDAAIAAQMVMTLVEPQSSGIGGGGFLIRFDGKTQSIETYDGRETAPASAQEDMFLDARGGPLPYRDAILGGRAVGVPGVIRMLELAHREHGRLPWPRLFRAAIQLSLGGFPISDRLARQIAGDRHLAKVPATKAYFFDGEAPKPAGTILKNPDLADTLDRIAEKGADAFYSGDLARAMADAVTNAPVHPAVMTVADISSYQAKKRPAVCADFRGYKVCGMGPPSSGGLAVGQTLGLLDHLPLAGTTPDSAQALHLIAEAERLAFADRAGYVGDRDFVPVPVEGMVDPGYLARRARLIDPMKAKDGLIDPGRPPGAQAAYPGPQDPLKGLSTAHMSIVDRFGNAISFTTTVESAFGSRLMVRGFLLNNQLTDFSFRPEWRGKPAPNRVAPGKRPRSSMSPTIVLDKDGRFLMAVGSPGGSRIIGYTARAVLGVLAWGLDMQGAVDLPHVMNRGGATEIEEPLIPAIAALKDRGHQVQVGRMVSGLQGILRTPAGLTGGADRRREGIVLGDAGDEGQVTFPAPRTYACADGSRPALAWADDFVQITETGQPARVLARVVSGSGARYADGAAEVWEHQGTVRVTIPGTAPRPCRKAGP